MSKTQPTDTDVPLDYDQDDGVESIQEIEKPSEDEQWVALARSNFVVGKTYMDAALTNQWERNADHFNSQHYRRSVYNSKLYRGRSRLFRPLTRSAERSSSSKLASALFANQDVVSTSPENHSDPKQVIASRVMQEILNYRLEKTIPWYLTVMGAWQDTRVYGPCCTKTWWNYQEMEVDGQESKKDINGNVIKGQFNTVKKTKVLVDEPVIDMVPPENLLCDPECDWRDPINTSPHVTHLVPMHVNDIMDKMESIDQKTNQPEWKPYSVTEILSSNDGESYNAVRAARDGDERPNKADSQERPEFKVIWCHENFVKLNGIDYVYWTLGTRYLLSDPVPIEEVYHTGKRPFVYGFSIIEAHKFAPSSATELISELQTGVNDIANLRFDNVKLALNKRYIIRRGASVDLEALMRSVPGGGVLTDDPERDVKVIDTRDVTGSSYKEQERLETESNDLSGSFLGGSVQNNRSLNETVGGMEMLSQGADAISEFDIRTFVETWVKPQLELLIQYIQKYETDEVIQNVSFDAAMKDLGIRYMKEEPEVQPDPEKDGMVSPSQVEEISNKALNDKMTIRVNVGLGATSPQKKIDMFGYILKTIGTIDPAAVAGLGIDMKEIVKEVFAAAGFQDGSRFASKEEEEQPDPAMQEQMEQMKQEAFEQGKMEGKSELDQMKIQSNEKVSQAKIDSAERVKMAEMNLKPQLEDRRNAARMTETQLRDKTTRDIAAVNSKNLREELNFKRTTGKPGV